jgi:two-component system sensor histidine kinase UhpB
MYLSSARNLGAAPSVDVQRFLDEGRALLGRYSGEIQTMARVLYPPELDELGLAAAIRWQIKGFSERSRIEVALEIPPDLPRLPAERELALFRVTEEALNILSHSGSMTASVHVFCDASEVGVEVVGAGNGIAGDDANGTRIQEIRERLRNAGGRFEIDSGRGGTRLRAVLSFVPG